MNRSPVGRISAVHCYAGLVWFGDHSVSPLCA